MRTCPSERRTQLVANRISRMRGCRPHGDGMLTLTREYYGVGAARAVVLLHCSTSRASSLPLTAVRLPAVHAVERPQRLHERPALLRRNDGLLTAAHERLGRLHACGGGEGK